MEGLNIFEILRYIGRSGCSWPTFGSTGKMFP